MYYKNQIFYILVSFCFFAYAAFHYTRYQDVESRSVLQDATIVKPINLLFLKRNKFVYFIILSANDLNMPLDENTLYRLMKF